MTLEFGFGAELDDPDGILLGEGKYRRHLRFTTPEAVDPTVIGRYVAQALARA